MTEPLSPRPDDEAPGVLSPEDLLRLLLVEDDDGDAVLVEELLADARVKVELHRATTLDVALEMLRLHDVHCVLLDLGLPDAAGLSAVERLQARPHPPALVVLTGHTGIDLGVQAVAAGADDYLVKGEVDGDLLGRSVRYAVQRRRSKEQQRALYRSEVRAAETARLERALLPRPLVRDDTIAVMVGYIPGGNGLLGGDFYDAVERADGSVLCLIGDVAGHGPDEAALGATLRTAWRTLVLSDVDPAQVLPLVERVLVPERARPEVFVTLCQVVISPDRASVDLYLAGHMPPLLLRDSCAELPTTSRGRALGIPVKGGWRAERVALEAPWALMLYTDGLIEATLAEDGAAGTDAPVGGPDRSAGRDTTDGPDANGAPERTAAPDRESGPDGARGTPARRERLGIHGLVAAVDTELAHGGEGLVERLFRRVRALHGGPLEDDAAVLVIGWGGPDQAARGERAATLADSDGWSQ